MLQYLQQFAEGTIHHSSIDILLIFPSLL